jgi:hypothetical protein
MAKREPKTSIKTSIEVVGRNGKKMGSFELTSGNFKYYRTNAPGETIRLTHQQLVSLLEKEIDYRSIDVGKIKLPNPHPDGDFLLSVLTIDELGDRYTQFTSTISYKKIDPRKIDLGFYQFSEDMSKERNRNKHPWFARVTVQAAIWIIYRYIDKFLLNTRSQTYVDDNIVVSKQDMKSILISLLKRLE